MSSTATPWLCAKVRRVERSARRSALKSRLHLLRSARTLLRTSCAEEEEGSAASGGMSREDVGGCGGVRGPQSSESGREDAGSPVIQNE